MSGYGAVIFPQHAELLEASAISPDVARERGYVSVDTKKRLESAGYKDYQCRVPGLLIPVHDASGAVATWQYRPDSPRTTKAGKTIKYETPGGSRLVLDVPPRIKSQLDDPSIPLWITEGARKADAAVSAGVACISLSGVDAWQGTNSRGGKTALGDWKNIALNDRRVYLAFDSDAASKPGVAGALERLGNWLAGHGATSSDVRYCYLPDGEDGTKVGLDDYLAAGGSIEDLIKTSTPELMAAVQPELTPAPPQEHDKGAASEQPASGSDRPIDITNEPAAITGISAAISKGKIPHLFVRGRQLVEVAVDDGDLQTRDLDADILRALMSENIEKIECTKEFKGQTYPALPYPITCRAILARASWPEVPKLRGVVSYPVLRGDGSILQAPGYDKQSGLFLHGRIGMDPIPVQPSAEDAASARKFLMDEYLRDFPWVSDADKANYLAVLMTPLLREVVNGLFPFVDITAPERGSGKTLLAQFLEILYGASMRTLPKDDAEMRKSISAALRGPHPVIIFDNIPEYATISSPALAAVLTMPMWTDRILGQSREGTWPNDRLWVATGTNIRLGGDFGQRAVLTRIDYGAPRPDLRAGFAIPDIDLWTADNRGEVIRALLILARSWQVAGAQRGSARMRNFTRWAEVLGGILGHHEIPGFLGNRDEIETHDDDAATWGHFLAVLRAQYGEIAKTTREILTDAAARKELADALPSTADGGPHTTKTLGKALSAHEGRWYSGGPGEFHLALRRAGDQQRAVLWRVAKHDPASRARIRIGGVLENSPNSPNAQDRRSQPLQGSEFGSGQTHQGSAWEPAGEFGISPNSPAET
ncbi:MAG: DUF3854 domain-containing protein, partial [Streptosporangiaceae bacterium]